MNHVFISHIKEEEKLASELQECLRRDFLGNLSIFLSSKDLNPGEVWFKEIIDNLQKTEVLLLMCSPRSINRCWLHFEAGAIFIKEKPVIPICYGGLKISDLPPQFRRMQAITLNDPKDIKKLYEVATKLLECDLPQVDYQGISQKLVALAAKQKILFIVSPDLRHKYYDGKLAKISSHFEVIFIDYSEIDDHITGNAYESEYVKIVYHHPHPASSDSNYLRLVEHLKNDNASLPLITFSESNCTDHQSATNTYEDKITFANMLSTLIQGINKQ